MATDYQAASDTIKRLAQQYQQLMDVAGVLDQIGTLDNAASEATRAQAKAQADLEIAQKMLDAAIGDMDVVKHTAAGLLSQAHDDADKILTDANTQAAAMVAKGTADASDMVAKAAADGVAAADALGAKVAGQRLVLAAVEKATADAQAALDAVNAQAADAEARLAKVQAQIQKLLGN
jgi:chromosome segregation ATPase